MAIEKLDSTSALEPDLICSKDGEVLERSERETVRIYKEVLFFSLPRLLSAFLDGRRF